MTALAVGIYLMRAVTDGRLELTETVKGHLDLCLDCRSCETACPSGVQYGRLIEPFRIDMQQHQHGGTKAKSPQGDWFQKWILYGLFPYPARLRWALAPAKLMQILQLDRFAEWSGLTRLLPERLRRMQRLLPPLKSREPRLPEFLPAIGPRRARVALFTGCVADAMFHHVNWATARSCKPMAATSSFRGIRPAAVQSIITVGAGQPALELARTNSQAFAAKDLDAVIVNVAGCGSMLKDYGHVAAETVPDDESTASSLNQFAGKVKDISEFLVALGPIAPKGEIRMKATYHDACHLCHAQKIREQPRGIVGTGPRTGTGPLG